MLGYYKYSRENIAKMIMESEQTDDGHYIMKNFPAINNKKGTINDVIDSSYYYNRENFKNKICFNEKDIECYLSKDKGKYDIDRMISLDEKIKNVTNGLLDFDLNDKIEDKEFTLSELIDTTIYIFNIKY